MYVQFLPLSVTHLLNARPQAVPIFNIDKRPFAILCAYSTGERTTPFVSYIVPQWLPSHSYLSVGGTRVIVFTGYWYVNIPLRGVTNIAERDLPGVIILSAVLKRRMILADKAKSLFISK